MLDVRHTAVGILEHLHSTVTPDEFDEHDADEQGSSSQLIRPISLTTGKAARISLEDMVNTTLALKSNLAVDIVKPVSQWPHAIFTPQTTSEEQFINSPSNRDEVPFPLQQVISSLQREVVLLRNELNFELWLSRENVKYIGRLYQDRVQVKAAENERQGLVGPFSFSCRSSSDTLAQSTTNCGSTGSKSLILRKSLANIKSKHLLQRQSTLTGTGDFKKN